METNRRVLLNGILAAALLTGAVMAFTPLASATKVSAVTDDSPGAMATCPDGFDLSSWTLGDAPDDNGNGLVCVDHFHIKGNIKPPHNIPNF